MFRIKIDTTPIEKNTRYTLNASTFPGKTFEIIAPVLVWRKFYEQPHNAAQTNDKGNDLVK